MKPRYMIASGGTGGHLFPAQQLADHLKGDCEILFAGHKLATSPFFEKEKIPFVDIEAHPLQKGFVSKVWKGFWQSIHIIRRFNPDAVVGFGSYHTFPVLLAALVLRKTIILFEANSILGKVNRLFSPFASKIAFQFPVIHSKGVQVPFLPWNASEGAVSPAEARVCYGLDPDCKTILVFGGSQGASFLNEAVPILLAELKEPVQVIHFTGKEGKGVSAHYEKFQIKACVKEFEKTMPLAYTAASIAICRSGAGTIGELIRFAVPSLLIPYPFASEDHQRKNGEFLTHRIGGARLLLQKDAQEKGRFLLELKNLLDSRDIYRTRLSTAYQEGINKIHLAQIVKNASER